MCDTIDTYKKLIDLVREQKLIGHTFTRKDERPYRIVIKNLHPTTPVEAIKEAMESTGNSVKGEIINAKYGPTKIPLSTFFVNLEPGPNNAAVKQLRHIYNTIVTIEDPKKKNTIPQCKRCQQYGHTQNNCMRPYRCVKCAGDHKTTDCSKTDRSTPAKCALCLGSHPANYKGCEVFVEIQRRKSSNRTLLPKIAPTQIQEHHDNDLYGHKLQNDIDTTKQKKEHWTDKKQRTFNIEKQGQEIGHGMTRTNKTYAQATVQDTKTNSQTIEYLLTKQSEKLDMLIQQIGTLMNLLTTVITKLTK